MQEEILANLSTANLNKLLDEHESLKYGGSLPEDAYTRLISQMFFGDDTALRMQLIGMAAYREAYLRLKRGVKEVNGYYDFRDFL